MDMGHTVFGETQSEVVRCLCWGLGCSRGPGDSEQGGCLETQDGEWSQEQVYLGWERASRGTTADFSASQTLLHTQATVGGWKMSPEILGPNPWNL